MTSLLLVAGLLCVFAAGLFGYALSVASSRADAEARQMVRARLVAISRERRDYYND